MSTTTRAWAQSLPAALQARAYRAGAEHAWAREDALAVIAALAARGHTVIGVDVWLATDPGPTIPGPFVYDWSAAQGGTAAQFIAGFAWDPADTSHGGQPPWFALTVRTGH
jgi:hypothetical protein